MIWQKFFGSLLKQGFPPGHFYSSVPNSRDIRKASASIFDRSNREIPGIILNASHQHTLLQELARYYSDDVFPQHKTAGSRYYFDNEYFSYGDAIFLHALIRHLTPTQIIEVGSGFSSAAILDTCGRYFTKSVECTFIEPHPKRLKGLLNSKDISGIRLLNVPVQSVPLDAFRQLDRGDILFVDGSHVLKTGSDVNDILFRILPALQPGVWVHFHDIFYPFEYHETWVLKDKRCWNEAYAIRAFLQFNEAFSIRLWNDYIGLFCRKLLEQHFPLALKNTGGSLWIERI